MKRLLYFALSVLTVSLAFAQSPAPEARFAAMSKDEVCAFEIEVTPRIGIGECADWPLRFLIRGNPFVSRR